jgi:hypothetical protein
VQRCEPIAAGQDQRVGTPHPALDSNRAIWQPISSRHVLEVADGRGTRSRQASPGTGVGSTGADERGADAGCHEPGDGEEDRQGDLAHGREYAVLPK